MQSLGPAHPHALASAAYAPAGMPLPGQVAVEVRRRGDGMRNLLDIAGGVAFALLVSILCMKVGAALFEGAGWVPVIAWESVWLLAAMLCAPLMPSGIRHDISWATTREGLALSWPMLVYATWVLGIMAAYLGAIRLDAGPIGLSLAVGVGEEFIFRVLLLGWLLTKLDAAAALALSSVVFGLAHLNELSLLGILSVAPQTGLGFVFGAVYLRTRNPLAPILAHAYWDFPYFMALGGRIGGGGTEAGMPGVMDLVPWLAFATYGLWLVRYGVPLAGRIDPVGCSCGACHRHGGAR